MIVALFDYDEPLHTFMEKVERDCIIHALQKARCNMTAAGKMLGISMRAVRYKMAVHRLQISRTYPRVVEAIVEEVP